MASRNRRIMPGFGVSLGITSLYLGLLVLLPLAALLLKASTMSLPQLLHVIGEPRALAAYKLSLGASVVASLVNVVFGVLICWVLVRYDFPGHDFADALVDLPFALPTAVAGIALTTLYAENGVFGKPLMALGIKAAFSPFGITVALIFVGIPFVVRTVQPVLEGFEIEAEEAAQTLGASRLQTFLRVILPALWPAILTGFALALARALGEYGSVVFISGNMPKLTEIAPVLVVTRLEQYDYAGATAIACVMLIVSFVLLLLINVLSRWTQRAEAT